MGARRQNCLPSNPSAEKVLHEACWLQNRGFSVETIHLISISLGISLVQQGRYEMPRDTKVNKTTLPSGALWSSQEDRHISGWGVRVEMFNVYSSFTVYEMLALNFCHVPVKE